MTETAALSKICPIMSQAVHETPSPGMMGVTINHEIYCVGSRCMSWEVEQRGTDTSGFQLPIINGYCKLMEERL